MNPFIQRGNIAERKFVLKKADYAAGASTKRLRFKFCLK